MSERRALSRGRSVRLSSSATRRIRGCSKVLGVSREQADFAVDRGVETHRAFPNRESK